MAVEISVTFAIGFLAGYAARLLTPSKPDFTAANQALDNIESSVADIRSYINQKEKK